MITVIFRMANLVPEVETFATMLSPPAEVDRCFSAFHCKLLFFVVRSPHIPAGDAKSTITPVEDFGVW